MEAQACGRVVIAPRGGPTDDFLHPDCAIFLTSQELIEESGRHRLAIEVGEITRAMISVVTAAGSMEKAALAGPAHVKSRFTWDIVTRQLVDQMKAVATPQ